MSATNDTRLISVAGPNADEAKRVMADADARAASIYGCATWLCRSADDQDRVLVESDSFSDVLFAAAIGAQAEGVTLQVYGRRPQSAEEVYVLTLQQPSVVVERWFRERLGVDEGVSVGIRRAVLAGAFDAMVRQRLQDAALAGADDGPSH